MRGVTMKLKFMPTTIFRETPKVTFFDAGIDSSNGSDVVIHSGEAISPPDNLKEEQLAPPHPIRRSTKPISKIIIFGIEMIFSF